MDETEFWEIVDSTREAAGGDPEVDGDAEDLGYAADEAYEQLTGVRLPDLDLPAQPAEPEGVYIDFENAAAVSERFPRLWERFG